MIAVFSELPQVAVAVFLSLIGGFGNFFQAKREGKEGLGIVHFAAELSTALTAGLSAFYLCGWKEVSEAITLLSVLLAANNSSEVLAYGRQQLMGRLKLIIPQQGDKK